MKIIPKCALGEIPYINFEGRWLPCCACQDPFWYVIDDEIYHKTFSADEYLILENDIEQMHTKQSFVDWLEHIKENYDDAPNACKKRCSDTSNIKEKTARSKNKVHTFDSKYDFFQFAQEHDLDADEIH
jgi:hypothetical protein